MADKLTIQKRTRPYTRPPVMVPIITGADMRVRLGLPSYQPPVQKPKKSRKTNKVSEKPVTEEKPVSHPPETRDETPPSRAPFTPRSAPPPVQSYTAPDRGKTNFDRPMYQAPRQNQEHPPFNRPLPLSPIEKKTPAESDDSTVPPEKSPPPEPKPPAETPPLPERFSRPPVSIPPNRRVFPERRSQPVDVDTDTQAAPEKQPPTVSSSPNSPLQPALPPDRTTPPTGLSQPPAVPQKMPSLGRLLARHSELPGHTAILGICDDQLPVLLDLYDPAPGALLIVGDERQMQLDLLRTAVASVVQRNSPRGVQFIVFSHLPDAWQSWVNEQGYNRHCLGVLGIDDPQAKEWMMRLADWAEGRRTGQRGGPPVVVLLDTLNFLPRLDYDIRLNFEWLVKEGSQAGIWTIAAISTALANSLSRQINHIFQTIIYGYTDDPSFYVKMAGLSDGEAKTFGASGQFAVKVASEEGETWLKFRLPS